MSVKTRDEIIEAVRKRIGEDTSDEAISLLEDVTDTFADYETKVADKTDWKTKYDEMDASWRKKYMDRFSGKTGEEVKEEQEEQIKDDSDPRTFDELFTEREG
nr:MAG TPA: hypothetical protein [Caudoviricetes sp.]